MKEKRRKEEKRRREGQVDEMKSEEAEGEIEER